MNRTHIRGLIDRILASLLLAEAKPVPSPEDASTIRDDIAAAKAALLDLKPEFIQEAHDVKALFDRIDLIAVRLRSVRNDLDAWETHIEKALENCRQLGAAAEDPQPPAEDDL